MAVFDDDRRAHGLSLLGVPVVGGIDDIPEAASRYTHPAGAAGHPLPLARAGRAGPAGLRSRPGVSMKVLPGVKDMSTSPTTWPPMRQAREPQIEDLLGRTPVPTDLESVRRSIAGTPGAGHRGRRLHRLGDLPPGGRASTRPMLVLLDHDETHLHDAAATVGGPCEQALSTSPTGQAVFEAFERYRPEVVFHAAAHKHVPCSRTIPLEAAKTNVLRHAQRGRRRRRGRHRPVRPDLHRQGRPALAASWGRPSGWPSRSCSPSAPEGGAYCTVRFGNVLGSRGSVIPTFARQIAQGGPVTVTDPRMTRFFMSVEEAVQLVLQASVLSDGGGRSSCSRWACRSRSSTWPSG